MEESRKMPIRMLTWSRFNLHGITWPRCLAMGHGSCHHSLTPETSYKASILWLLNKQETCWVEKPLMFPPFTILAQGRNSKMFNSHHQRLTLLTRQSFNHTVPPLCPLGSAFQPVDQPRVSTYKTEPSLQAPPRWSKITSGQTPVLDGSDPNQSVNYQLTAQSWLWLLHTANWWFLQQYLLTRFFKIEFLA